MFYNIQEITENKKSINNLLERKISILGENNGATDELKQLINEVLDPIKYNLMVTPKEIDYLIDKLSMLIGNGINKSLHDQFNPTK